MNKYFTLSNGTKIPSVGFGTWRVDENATEIITNALKVGYRHIDTAAWYENEADVGAAIKASGIPREELFITTKLNNPDHGYQKTVDAFRLSLEKLGLDYVDLYLIHWPNPLINRNNWEEMNAESWKAFEEFYSEGRARAIGVSNFRVHHLEALMKTAEITPHVNQIRLCPGDVPADIIDYCKQRDIFIESYSSIARNAVDKIPEIHEIANRICKTVAQVCLRWVLQQGYAIMPKSTKTQRMISNMDVFDFELSESDMNIISNLPVGCCGLSKDPDTVLE